MIKRLLRKNPENRYGFRNDIGIEKIKKHQYLSDISLPLVLAKKHKPTFIPSIHHEFPLQSDEEIQQIFDQHFPSVDPGEDPFPQHFL